MRIPSLILAGVAAILLTGLAGSQEKANPPAKDKAEEPAKKLKELQKERIAALKQVAEISLKLATAGRLDVGEALEARMTLLNAELETAEKVSDRIALYQKTIEAMKLYEALAKAQFLAGKGTELNVSRVKARRLEVEIALERAKDKEAKKGK